MRLSISPLAKAAVLSAAVAASSCGGGGGGSSPFVAASPTSTAEGLYNALTITNRVVKWLMLDDGSYYLFYNVVGKPNDLGGVVIGSATSTATTLGSSNARDFNFEGQGVRSTTLSADYVAKKSIAGTANIGGIGTTLSGSYDAAYESTATLSALSGTYVGAVAASAGVQAGAITVNGSGAMTGVWFGCVVTGTATPRGKGNAYDLAISFSNLLSCSYSGQNFKGVGYVDAANKRFYAAAPNDARTDGVLFIGQQP